MPHLLSKTDYDLIHKLRKIGKISYLHIEHHILCSFISFITLLLFTSLILVSSPRMRPQLFPSSIFFIWITFLFAIKIIPTSVFADYSKYTNCKNSFSCGAISGVKFPFWGGDRDAYCGRSELKLSCQEDVPKFTINSETYRILDFDSSTQSFSVARDDYFITICPTPYNNTLDAMFRYNDGIVNITLLYGCSPTTSGFKKKSCGSSDGNVFYAIDVVEYKGSCTSTVVIQINDTFVPEANNGDLQDAIKQGFSLQSVDSDKCETCMASYGECGYRSGAIHLFLQRWGS